MPERIKAVDGSIPASLGVYDEESTRSVELGTRLEMNDGRVFRYVGCGGTGIAVGQLVAYGGTVLDIDASDPVVSITNYNGTDTQNPWIEMTAGSTDFTANLYDDGFLVIDSSTGAGQMRKVRTNTATIIKLYDPLVTAVSATTHGHLIPNPYDNVKLSVASGTNYDRILGATVRALTADYFGWILTRGWAALEFTATPALGQAVVQSTTAGEAIISPTAAQTPGVATCLYTVVTAGDYALAWIDCE